MHLDALVAHLNALLGHDRSGDHAGAFNGLQVANSGHVRRVAVAVDAHRDTLRAAVDQGADFLIVHHGLFWTPPAPITGPTYHKLKLCLDHDLAVYASHLPLDAHPEVGNTIGLARALGLEGGEPWFESHGWSVGLRFQVDLDRDVLAQRLRDVTGQALVCPWGPSRIRALGIVTGGAGSELAEAARAGLDTFVTGEGPHWTDGLARDLGLNLLYGGHYATETFGVKALGRHLETTFGLPWTFLDLPSSL